MATGYSPAQNEPIVIDDSPPGNQRSRSLERGRPKKRTDRKSYPSIPSKSSISGPSITARSAPALAGVVRPNILHPPGLHGREEKRSLEEYEGGTRVINLVDLQHRGQALHSPRGSDAEFSTKPDKPRVVSRGGLPESPESGDTVQSSSMHPQLVSVPSRRKRRST